MTRRVLHVVDRLTGGVPIAVREYISNSPSGFDHTVLAPYVEGAPAAVWEGMDASMLDLGSDRVTNFLRIRSALKIVDPHVIHAHSSFPGLLVRAGRLSAPVVYSPHCFKFDDPAASQALRVAVRLAERTLAPRTSTFAVLSEHEGLLAESLDPRARTVRIPNTPSTELARSPTVDVPGSRVGMIGRLAKQKDPSFFATLASHLHEDRPDVDTTWLGGGGGDWDEEFAASGVSVSGWLSKQELVSALDGLAVYVHTASYEGFPLSVLDAAARRVPIVARRIPALEEVGLTTFDTPRQGAELVRRAIEDSQFRRGLIDAGDRILEIMNSGTQREALRRIWSH